VIGIMPAWFSYPDQSVQLWTPIYHEINADEMRALDSHDFVVVGRLRPKVTETEAATELSLITARIHNQHLDDPYISKAANSQPLLNDMVGEIKRPLYVLLAAAGCLLAIACLNVASLLVARGSNNVIGIFRSTNAGKSWTRINDDHHPWGSIGTVVGDPRVFGRVYLGTNGRGIIYGDPASGN
jgi:hypothetical protein